MKGRESGMPQQDYWETFFDASCVLRRLVTRENGALSVAEFGSGYGTFTLPLARLTSGAIHAFDIEPELVRQLAEAAVEENLSHVSAVVRDFVKDGTGLPDASVDHAMLYNLLHIEEPQALIAEARRIVRPGGTVSVIHWRSDRPTPRGPSLAIRPTPEQVTAWLTEAGFCEVTSVDISCCTHHYGLVATQP